MFCRSIPRESFQTLDLSTSYQFSAVCQDDFALDGQTRKHLNSYNLLVKTSKYSCGTTVLTIHYSTLLKTQFESSVAETYLQAVSQKCQTVLAKLELPHFIETVFVYSWQATLPGSGNSPP